MLSELKHVLAELKEMFAEVTRNLRGALIVTDEVVKSTRGKMAKSALPLSHEDMDTRLRLIRHYITPRELAALLHCHVETVYRMVKSGMPVDRDVDGEGRGRNLKIYPPRVADWRAECRDSRIQAMQSKLALPDNPQNRGTRSRKRTNGE